MMTNHLSQAISEILASTSAYYLQPWHTSSSKYLDRYLALQLYLL